MRPLFDNIPELCEAVYKPRRRVCFVPAGFKDFRRRKSTNNKPSQQHSSKKTENEAHTKKELITKTNGKRVANCLYFPEKN